MWNILQITTVEKTRFIIDAFIFILYVHCVGDLYCFYLLCINNSNKKVNIFEIGMPLSACTDKVANCLDVSCDNFDRNVQLVSNV